MPKEIEVTLQQISCTANKFGGSVQLSGDVFGATFQNNPDDPNDKQVQIDIFPFPAGPISISEGQAVPITMIAPRFNLSAPSVEDPNLFPKFLKFGGTLNLGLGSNFIAIRFDEGLPSVVSPPEHQVPPRQFDLTFSNPNLTVTLTFGLIIVGVF